MPTDQKIKESIERIQYARKNGMLSVSIHAAMVLLNAYREEGFTSLGLEDYDGE